MNWPEANIRILGTPWNTRWWVIKNVIGHSFRPHFNSYIRPGYRLMEFKHQRFEKVIKELNEILDNT